MFQGNLDTYLEKVLIEKLNKNDPFKNLELLFENENKKIIEFNKKREENIQKLELLLKGASIKINVGNAPILKKQYNSFQMPENTPTKWPMEEKLGLRLGTSLGVGAITTGTVALISTRLANKGTFNGLGVVLAKVLGKKTGSTVFGGVVGGFLGSVIPIFGTTTGTIIGGTVLLL